MDVFVKAAAGVLITLVLSLILTRQGKDYALLLVIAVCAMVGATAFLYIEKILDFLKTLESVGSWDPELMLILLKSAGIGILTEITVMICGDSGNAALGKILQILSAAVILWLCIPLFTQLLDLVKQLLGGV